MVEVVDPALEVTGVEVNAWMTGAINAVTTVKKMAIYGYEW